MTDNVFGGKLNLPQPNPQVRMQKLSKV